MISEIRSIVTYYLKILGLLLVLQSCCRVLFYSIHYNYFPDAGIAEFLLGIRFDLSIEVYLLSLFFLVAVFTKNNQITSRLKIGAFTLASMLLLIFNLIDIGYFSFTLKRTTADILSYTKSNDLLRLIPLFLIDYWYLFLFFLVLLGSTIWIYKRIQIAEHKTITSRFITLTIVSIFTVIAGRGGFQLKPITIINAVEGSVPSNIPLILNTPFSFTTTLFLEEVKAKVYYSEEELKSIYRRRKDITSSSDLTNKNVVILILESFGKEYIGYHNQGKGYTPFLDSLMKQSIVFTDAHANGKRSIEALPAIFAGIPSLRDEAYIYSPYATNKIWALPEFLTKSGYHTSFFHGGLNGTMGFDIFCKQVGINHYFGKNEYPTSKDFDGNWGIYDEPYLHYVSDQLATFKQPFLSSVFTLSSHHPYSIPEKHKGQFPKGELEIHETIGYTDHALRQFFKEASNQEWFKNTIFIITADHTAQALDPFYGNPYGKFEIPLVVYDPTKKHQEVTRTTQQIDIPLLILSSLGIKEEVRLFGNNPFDSNHKHQVVNINNGIYQLVENDTLFQFDGINPIAMYDVKADSLMQENILKNHPSSTKKYERQIKAILQTYDDALINNKLY